MTTTLSRRGERRLNKLADFLDGLDPKKFDFASVVAKSYRDQNGRLCGSVCCAIGWTPVVFPRVVEWGSELYCRISPTIRQSGLADFLDVGKSLFGLSYRESDALFSPLRAIPWWPKRYISENALPKTVAKSIRKFIEWKKEGNSL